MLTLKSMLEIGKECGLDTVAACHANVNNHYDAFFSCKDDWKEMTDFNNLMLNSPLIEVNNGDGEAKYRVRELPIDEALKLLEGGMKIIPARYEQLQEQFDLYYAESGMAGELDCDKEKEEFNFISRELGCDDWEVLESE